MLSKICGGPRVALRVAVLGKTSLTYRAVFCQLFESVVFVDLDDDIGPGSWLSDDVQAIVCGGGDIITPQYMDRVQRILATTSKPCYAVSVSAPLPLTEHAKYLALFDHVWVRSKTDEFYALQAVGRANVTRLPDLAFCLAPPPKRQADTRASKLRIGLALGSGRTPAAVELVRTILGTYDADVILVSFSDGEVQMNRDLSHAVALTKADSESGVVTVLQPPTSAARMLEVVSYMDFLVCAHYHAVVFAALCNVPFVALLDSQRNMENLLTDLRQSHRGVAFDVEAILQCLLHQDDTATSAATAANGGCMLQYVRSMRAHMSRKPRRVLTAQLLRQVLRPPPFEQVLQRFRAWEQSEGGSSSSSSLSNTVRARLASLALTQRVSGPPVAALLAQQPRDWPQESLLRAVYDQNNAPHILPQLSIDTTAYLAKAKSVFIDLHAFGQSDFDGLHRAGWAHVMHALHVLDASLHGGRAPTVTVDMCMERTFAHDAAAALQAADGALPYTRPWIGFLHHPLADNDRNLFKQRHPLFLSSLDTCKCIVVFSKTQQARVEHELAALYKHHVHVRTLTHPTDLAAPPFSWSRFLRNPCRRVVQIGGWLRDTYAIYELPLDPSWRNPLRLRKAVLRSDNGDTLPSPKLVAALNQAALPDAAPRGLVSMVSRHLASVEAIDRLPNAAYDTLLSENVVFLNLVDACAVNTVVECVVRGTPFLVNRLPSLEELLGKHYPGFYQNLRHAADLLGQPLTLAAIHAYLKARIDKHAFCIDTFLTGFAELLGELFLVPK